MRAPDVDARRLHHDRPVSVSRARPRHRDYIRNAVQVTVDAYDGKITFYVADDEDPLIRTYAKAFPGMFRPLTEVPKDLQAHIRYPEDLFTVQAKMYATYHMEDPQVFYNKEDLWVVPRLPQEGRDKEMEPYFMVMRLPASPKRNSSCSRGSTRAAATT